MLFGLPPGGFIWTAGELPRYEMEVCDIEHGGNRCTIAYARVLSMLRNVYTVYETRPDTRHKMRLVCVLFTFENNTGRADGHNFI